MEITQYHAGLLFRSSWLIEQLVKTNIELIKLEDQDITKVHTHKSLVSVDGMNFEGLFELRKRD